MRGNLSVGDAKNLNFEDNFDLFIITTIHNLEYNIALLLSKK